MAKSYTDASDRFITEDDDLTVPVKPDVIANFQKADVDLTAAEVAILAAQADADAAQVAASAAAQPADLVGLETEEGAQDKADAAQAAAIATAAGDATTKAGNAQSAAQMYADTQLAVQLGLITLKPPVRAIATTNVNVANPGTAVFDGVTISPGQSVLLPNQTLLAQNWLYTFNGSDSAMTRRADSDTSTEVKGNSFVFVQEGSPANRDKLWQLTTDDPIVLGITPLTVVSADLTGFASQSALDAESTARVNADLTKRSRYVDQGTPKTSAYAMAVWDRATYDCTAGSISQSPPSSPSAGDEIQLYLSATAGSNALTLTGTGLSLDTAGHGITAMWTGSAWVAAEDRKTKSSLDDAYAMRLKILEGQPFFTYGHSYNVTGGASTALFHARLASRHGTQAVTQRGVAGNRMDQTLANIKSNWTPNTRGLVSLISIYNDVNQYGTASNGPTTTAEAFRSCLAYLTSSAVLTNADTAFAYSSTGWASGVSSANGAYVDFGFVGDSAYLLVEYVTGSGATAVVTRTGDGATVATISTGGYQNAFTGAVKLSGFGSGSHSVRVTIQTGNALTLTGAAIPADTPPVVVFVAEGSTLSYNGAGAGDITAKNNALSSSYIPACQTVAATFPSCRVALPDSTWDPVTMLLTDNVHPNDKGHSYYADRVQQALRTQSFVQGLNFLSRSNAGSTYTGSTPSYFVPGPPAQVGQLFVTPSSGQMAISWAAPSANGFAITDYVIQYRTTTGPGAWTTVADGVSTTTNVTITGLVNGTSYDFQVAAVNSAGQGSYSAAVSGTAGTASVPGNPTGLAVSGYAANQVSLTWTAPVSNGGATITDYVIQYRTTVGPGSWTTFADGTSTATSGTVTGLVNGTSYDFQVAAVNGIGTSTYSSTATGVARSYLAFDDFNRADTTTGLGTTNDGLFTWSTTARHRILSNKMQGIAGTTAITTINVGVSSYTVQATPSGTPAGTNTALIVRAQDSTNWWGIYWGTANVSSHYSITKSNAGTFSFPLITGQTPVAGDIVKVVVTPTTIELIVNNVSLGVVTDSFLGSVTNVGFWQSTATVCAFDDFQVT